MFTCKNKMKAFFIFLIISNGMSMHGMFRQVQSAANFAKKSLLLSRKYPAMPSMNESAYSIQNRGFSNTHSNGNSKNNSWNSRNFNWTIGGIGSAGLMSGLFTKQSAQAETPAEGDFQFPRTINELKQLTDEQKIAIIEDRARKSGWYFSGETETLEPKDKQKIYKLIYKNTPEELDSTIAEEFYTYLEELGFQNPERYILLYRVPHSKQAVADNQYFAEADSACTGYKSGIIRVGQWEWQQLTPMERRKLLIHEIIHILDRHNTRLGIIYLEKEMGLSYDKFKRKSDKTEAENEVYAEIAALDLSCFPETSLLAVAINNEQNKTPGEHGHLLSLEKPFALSMWKKKKEELGLKTNQSILEYHHKNGPALRDFSVVWVKNRKKNIEEAYNYANHHWELNPTIGEEDIRHIFKEDPEKLDPKIKEELFEILQEMGYVTSHFDQYIFLYKRPENEKIKASWALIRFGKNTVVLITDSDWKCRTREEKRHFTACVISDILKIQKKEHETTLQPEVGIQKKT